MEIYDFQARTEWICDLNQYIDAKHYGPDINDAMAEEMAAGLSRVTDAAQLEANNDVTARWQRRLWKPETAVLIF